MLFLLYCVGAMGSRQNLHYSMLGESLVETSLAYLRSDSLAWLLIAVTIGRIYLILRRRAAPLPLPLPLWDGLALGGVACFLRTFTFVCSLPTTWRRWTSSQCCMLDGLRFC